MCAWSYSSPLADTKDQVRFLVQDTDSTAPLIQDEEIVWQLMEFPNVRRAAAEVASQIALKFARTPDIKDGDTTVSYSQRATQYAALARTLKREATLLAAVPYAGGISIADKQTGEADTDRVRPAFSRELFGLTTEPTHTLTQTDEEDA